jgi:hypothetical protein
VKLQANIQDLENLAEQHDQHTVAKLPPISQLVMYWPFIRAALKLLKVFTGPKADKRIDDIILWGDLLSMAGKPKG